MKTLFRLFTSLALCALCLTACQDDEFMSMPLPSAPPSTSDTRAVNATSSLVQNADGTWTATRRVPLVGEGRVIDDINNGLIEVISTEGSGESNIENMVDLDLTNTATFGQNVLDADVVLNEIISVRDLNHIYAAGQTVGFTYRMNNPGLINADVLSGFWIKTYLGEQKQQEITGANNDGSLLNLNLLSTLNTDNIQSLSFKTDKPFDKMVIGTYGIDGNVLNVVGNLEIYYAFVGEDPIIPVYTGCPEFPNAKINEEKSQHFLYLDERLMDSDITGNYIETGGFIDQVLPGGIIGDILGGLTGLLEDLIEALFNSPAQICVDLGKEVPAGTEIGFNMSQFKVLSADVLSGIKFVTYDANGTQVEEFTAESSGLLGASVLEGGRSSIAITTNSPCQQVQLVFTGINLEVLGETRIYHLYVREAAEPDLSSYFSVSNVTISGNSYHLPQPAEGRVEWTFTGGPAGSAAKLNENTTKIYDMTVDGDYRLNGVYTYTDGNGESHTENISFIITRETPTTGGENCNQLIGGKFGATASVPEGGGALITTGNVKNIEALITPEATDYAVYNNIGSIAIGQNYGIARVELGEGQTINKEGQPTRVGFTMQTQGQFLHVSALNFFRIKLYKGEEVVDESVADENSTVAADLIGSQGNKMRMSIVTEKEFDAIELWISGVADLSLGNEYRLYNAFYEDASEGSGCENYDASEACIELLTAGQGAEINYAYTQIGGAAQVGGTLNDLSNIIDDDKTTYATLTSTTVLGNTTVAVKFPTMPGGTQAGFIVTDPNYVAGVEVLEEIKLEAFMDGVSVGNSGETSEGGLADVSLIGYSGRKYIEVTPNWEFNELRITFAGVADVLNFIYIDGVYVRRDSDNDGIPDCAEDDENQTPETPPFLIEGFEAETEHACSTNIRMNITVNENVDLTPYIGQEFTLICTNDATGEVITKYLTLDENHGFTLTDMESGDYRIALLRNGVSMWTNAHAVLHPLQTTWKQSPANTDWNNWNNWTKGAPWTCTNVIIPGGCTDYPVLKEDAENNCANLHISAGGEIVNTQYLDQYDYAWVELSMQPNTYYMLSAPLKDMVTGDMFVPESWNFGNSAKDYFTALTPMTAPESRFTPRVYQRFWAREVPGKIISDGTLASEVIVSQTDWTAPFNAVAEAYDKGMGFSASITGAATFRFPKEHREYTYFDGAGNSTGQTEGVARNTQNVGHFWTDGWTNGDSFTVTSTNLEAGETFVVGNPFMTHINIQKFLEANPNITAVKLYDGNSIVTITNEEATETGYTHIEPMQSFYVTATKGTSLEVTFNAAMQEAKPGYQVMNAPAVQTRAETRGLTDNGNRNTLRLTATCDSRNTSCLVRLSPSADDAYRTGEDSRLLIDTQAEPTVAVFTVADGKALDIQQRRSGTDIPVGLRMKRQGRVTLTLSHRTGDDWTGWTLVDRQTGRRYPLTDGYTYIDLGTTGTTTNRLYLTKE